MFKKSATSVHKNRDKWSNNFKSKNTAVPKYVIPLFYGHEIPKEADVIGRYIALSDNLKSRKNTIEVIAKELNYLWIKLNKDAIRLKNIKEKVSNLIIKYQKFLKRRNVISFHKMFDISYKKRLQCYPINKVQSYLIRKL